MSYLIAMAILLTGIGYLCYKALMLEEKMAIRERDILVSYRNLQAKQQEKNKR